MEYKDPFYEAEGAKFLNPVYFTEGIREYLALETEFIVSQLKDSESILDVGCGEGRYLRILAPLVGRITGLDYSLQLIDQATESTQQFNNVQLILGSVENLEELVHSKFQHGLLAWNTIGNIPQELHRPMMKYLKSTLKKSIFLSTYKCNEFVMGERLRYYEKIGFMVDSIEGDTVVMQQGRHVAKAFPIEYFSELLESSGFHMRHHDLGSCGIVYEGYQQAE